MATPFTCSFNIFYIYQTFILLFHKALHPPPSFSPYLSLSVHLSLSLSAAPHPVFVISVLSLRFADVDQCFLLAIQDAVVPSSDHCRTETVLPPSYQYCFETVVPSGDHYCINIVVPSSDHCRTETVPPSSDHYGTMKVAPPSDHLRTRIT